MGKAAMCIQLLEILSTGRVYKISDLANLLETNPRNIVEYKKELEECGYYILSISGRYGGYQLEKSAVIPALKLLTEEKTTLLESFNYVMSKKDFPKKETLIKAMGKVSASIELEEKENDLLVVDHYQLTMSEKDIQERYHFIEEAIEKKRIIEIEYESIKSGLKIHKLHPYKLFIYNNSWFFLALNPEVGEIWYFKLNRIRHFHMLDGKFTVWKNFKAEDVEPYLYDRIEELNRYIKSRKVRITYSDKFDFYEEIIYISLRHLIYCKLAEALTGTHIPKRCEK